MKLVQRKLWKATIIMKLKYVVAFLFTLVEYLPQAPVTKVEKK